MQTGMTKCNRLLYQKVALQNTHLSPYLPTQKKNLVPLLCQLTLQIPSFLHRLKLLTLFNNKVNKDTLKSRAGNLIKEFFDPSKNNLEQELNFNELTNNILSIEGVKRIFTRNDTNSSSIDTVSFLSFNPVYETSDISLVNQNITLPYFKFPYLYSPLSISNRIKVIDE